MFRFALVVAAACSFVSVSFADEKSHRTAAEQLLRTLRVEKTISDTVDPVIDHLIKTNDNISRYRTALKQHLSKQLAWEVLKDEWISAYVEEFSEPELLELAKFYQSPLGQKALDKQPKLTSRLVDLAVKKAMDNKEELRKAIEAEAKKN